MNKFKKLLLIGICICLLYGMTVVSYSATDVNSQTVLSAADGTLTGTTAAEAAASATVQTGSILYQVTGITFGTSLVNPEEYVIPQMISNEEYLFLPSDANLKSLVVNFNTGMVISVKKGNNELNIPRGTAVDISNYLGKASADGSYALTVCVTINNVPTEFTLHVLKSANIASMYINSKDPVNKGIYYIASNKSNSITGSMLMVNADGSLVYAGGLSQVKTRGNSTWASVKKPFQIKLAVKTDLCQTGDSDNASKTWILLANAFDPTLIHNTVAFDMSRQLGLLTPDSRAVDLFFDHKYYGSYLLTEKVQVEKGRVNIDDNGYLLEMDLAYGTQEDAYVIDSLGTCFVFKAPEEVTEGQKVFVTSVLNQIIQATQNGGIDPATGMKIEDMVDLDSLAKLYVLEETVKDPDAFVSSIYFYIPSGGKLTAGPVWDFDSSFGIRKDTGMDAISGRATHIGWMDSFFKLPEFKKLVRKYESELYTITNREVSSGISAFVKEINASQKMDEACYRDFELGIYYELPTYTQNVSYMRSFLSARNNWAKSNLGK